MRPSTCTSPIFQPLIFQYWLHLDCILITRLLMFQYRLHPPLTQSYWSRPCYKTARCAAPSWKQTDKSSIGITKWGSRDQRVCIGIAIITYWASPNLCPSVAGTASGRVWYILLYLSLHWGHPSDPHYIGFKPRAVIVRLTRINCCAWALIVVDCWPIVVLGHVFWQVAWWSHMVTHTIQQLTHHTTQRGGGWRWYNALGFREGVRDPPPTIPPLLKFFSCNFPNLPLNLFIELFLKSNFQLQFWKNSSDVYLLSCISLRTSPIG